MGSENSLVKMGFQTFRILEMIENGKALKDIKEVFFLERKNRSDDERHRVNCLVNKLVNQLKDCGWISGKEGMYSLTNAGTYFIKAVYRNNVIRERLEDD